MTEGRSLAQRRLIRLLVVVAVVAILLFGLSRISNDPDLGEGEPPGSTVTTVASSTTPTISTTRAPTTSTSPNEASTTSIPTTGEPHDDGSVYVITVSGGSGTFLTPGSQPVWSPDGTTLALTAPADQ